MSKTASSNNEMITKRTAGLNRRLIIVAFMIIAVAAAAAGTLAYLKASSGSVNNMFTAAPVYTLIYDANADNEDIEVPDSQISYGAGNFVISDNEPLRENYAFDGWNTEKNGSGEKIMPGDDYHTDAFSTTLYAQWVYNGYILNYDANGGYFTNDSGESYTVHKEEVIDTSASHTFTVLNLPILHDTAGKTFMGWAESADADEPLYAYNGTDCFGEATLSPDITLVSPSREKTLYAVWGIKYTITFDANAAIGGYGNVPDPLVAISRDGSHTFTLPIKADDNTPTRDDDYYFGWWGVTPVSFTEEGGYQYGDAFTVSADNPEITLWAFYKPYGETRLTFDKNTTDTSVKNIPEPMANSLTPSIWIFDLPDNVPTRTNYLFMGWSHDKTATVPEYQPGDEYVLNKIINHRPTLYAVWKPKHTFYIRFYANRPDSTGTAYVHYLLSNGTPYTTSSYNYYNTAQITDETYTWDRGFWLEHPQYATMADTELGSYEFLGWAYDSKATEPDFTVDENGCIEQDITVTEPNNPCTGGSHYTNLYAVWKKNPLHTYKIYFVGRNSQNNTYNKIRTVDRQTGTASSWGSTVYSVMKNPNGSSISIGSWGGLVFKKDTCAVSVKSATWDEEFWETNSPIATRDSTSTEEYKHIGWAYSSSEAANGTVRIPVDDDGYIRQDITIEEPDDPCAGTTHNLVLWPVFKKIPHHTFNIIFTSNVTQETTAPVLFHTYDPENDTWNTETGATSGSARDINGKNVSFSSIRYYKFTSGVLPATTTEWILDTDFWNTKGLYCTKEDTNVSTYTFKGWAYSSENAAAGIVDVPVDENGFITKDITVKEEDVTYNHCTDDNGYEHNLVLYAVWEFTPLNTYRLFFCGNGAGSTNHYMDSTGTWKTRAVSYPNSKTTVLVGDGRSGEEEKKYIFRAHDYVTATFPAGEARSYTWDTDFWEENGVYATRDYINNTRYEFLGWAFDENAATPDFTVDENGIIQQDITAYDPYNSDETGGYFTMVLYAVWKEIPQHSYDLVFNRNGGYDVKFINPDTGKWTYTRNSKTYTSGNIDISDEVDSYTWDTAFWEANGVYASKSKTNDYTFDFLGWSTDPNSTDPEYKVDENNIITRDIVFDDPDGEECTGGKHTLTLYAIWKPVPRTRNYILKFDGNAGSPVPDTIIQTETFDEVEWHGSTFTIPKTPIPVNQRFMFVGWAESKNATIGTYGYPNEANPDIYTATQYLQPEYFIPTHYAESDSYRTKTLYAIWRYEFETTYYANGGAHAPSMRHDYTTLASCTLRVEDDEVIPVRDGYTFLGWSRDPNATEPEYTHDASLGYPTQLTVPGNSDGFTAITLYAVWQEN